MAIDVARRPCQRGKNEGGLGIGVRLSIAAMARGQFGFESGVFGGHLRIETQCIAKPDVPQPELAAVNYDMQVVRAVTVGPAHKPLAVGQRRIELG